MFSFWFMCLVVGSLKLDCYATKLGQQLYGGSTNLCELPIEVGKCRGTIYSFAFNVTAGDCIKYRYGGCEGNENRFDNRRSCSMACGVKPSKDACQLPVVRGPCDKRLQRYYYDGQERRCEPFWYSGCHGNQNNFETLQGCETSCVDPDNKEFKPKSQCTYPHLANGCQKNKNHYFYDVETSECKLGNGGDCQQHQNYFDTLHECEQTCSKTLKQAICSLPPLVGPCYNTTLRYYYDADQKECVVFPYGGCRGNQNNFRNFDECHQKCSTAVAQVRETCPLNYKTFKNVMCSKEQRCPAGLICCFTGLGYQCVPPKYDESEPDEFSSICDLPVNTGLGKATRFIRYFYDKISGHCQPFSYTGSGGNPNNFMTLQDCKDTCRTPKKTVWDLDSPSNVTLRVPRNLVVTQILDIFSKKLSVYTYWKSATFDISDFVTGYKIGVSSNLINWREYNVYGNQTETFRIIGLNPLVANYFYIRAWIPFEVTTRSWIVKLLPMGLVSYPINSDEALQSKLFCKVGSSWIPQGERFSTNLCEICQCIGGSEIKCKRKYCKSEFKRYLKACIEVHFEDQCCSRVECREPQRLCGDETCSKDEICQSIRQVERCIPKKCQGLKFCPLPCRLQYHGRQSCPRCVCSETSLENCSRYEMKCESQVCESVIVCQELFPQNQTVEASNKQTQISPIIMSTASTTPSLTTSVVPTSHIYILSTIKTEASQLEPTVSPTPFFQSNSIIPFFTPSSLLSSIPGYSKISTVLPSFSLTEESHFSTPVVMNTSLFESGSIVTSPIKPSTAQPCEISSTFHSGSITSVINSDTLKSSQFPSVSISPSMVTSPQSSSPCVSQNTTPVYLSTTLASKELTFPSDTLTPTITQKEIRDTNKDKILSNNSSLNSDALNLKNNETLDIKQDTVKIVPITTQILPSFSSVSPTPVLLSTQSTPRLSNLTSAVSLTTVPISNSSQTNLFMAETDSESPILEAPDTLIETDKGLCSDCPQGTQCDTFGHCINMSTCSHPFNYTCAPQEKCMIIKRILLPSRRAADFPLCLSNTSEDCLKNSCPPDSTCVIRQDESACNDLGCLNLPTCIPLAESCHEKNCDASSLCSIASSKLSNSTVLEYPVCMTSTLCDGIDCSEGHACTVTMDFCQNTTCHVQAMCMPLSVLCLGQTCLQTNSCRYNFTNNICEDTSQLCDGEKCYSDEECVKEMVCDNAGCKEVYKCREPLSVCRNLPYLYSCKTGEYCYTRNFQVFGDSSKQLLVPGCEKIRPNCRSLKCGRGERCAIIPLPCAGDNCEILYHCKPIREMCQHYLCRQGETCYVQKKSFFEGYDLSYPTCIQKGDSCDSKDCFAEEVCVYETVPCEIGQYCHPIAKCIPRVVVCQKGECYQNDKKDCYISPENGNLECLDEPQICHNHDCKKGEVCKISTICENNRCRHEPHCTSDVTRLCTQLHHTCEGQEICHGRSIKLASGQSFTIPECHNSSGNCSSLSCSSTEMCIMEKICNDQACLVTPRCLPRKLSCKSQICSEGSSCYLKSINCDGSACPVVPVCYVKYPNCPKCSREEVCVFEQVRCMDSTCPKVPICVAKSTLCSQISCKENEECIVGIDSVTCQQKVNRDVCGCKPGYFCHKVESCSVSGSCLVISKCLPNLVSCSQFDYECGSHQTCLVTLKHLEFGGSDFDLYLPTCVSQDTSCNDTSCAPNQVCRELYHKCADENCPPSIECLSKEYGCENVRCQSNEFCVMKQTECPFNNCVKVPSCLKHANCDSVVCPPNQECFMEKLPCEDKNCFAAVRFLPVCYPITFFQKAACDGLPCLSPASSQKTERDNHVISDEPEIAHTEDELAVVEPEATDPCQSLICPINYVCSTKTCCDDHGICTNSPVCTPPKVEVCSPKEYQCSRNQICHMNIIKLAYTTLPNLTVPTCRTPYTLCSRFPCSENQFCLLEYPNCPKPPCIPIPACHNLSRDCSIHPCQDHEECYMRKTRCQFSSCPSVPSCRSKFLKCEEDSCPEGFTCVLLVNDCIDPDNCQPRTHCVKTNLVCHNSNNCSKVLDIL